MVAHRLVLLVALQVLIIAGLVAIHGLKLDLAFVVVMFYCAAPIGLAAVLFEWWIRRRRGKRPPPPDCNSARCGARRRGHGGGGDA